MSVVTMWQIDLGLTDALVFLRNQKSQYFVKMSYGPNKMNLGHILSLGCYSLTHVIIQKICFLSDIVLDNGNRVY